MAHLHHPHIFSHEWFELHPAFVAGLKKGGISLGMGALIAASVVLVTRLELNVPLRVAAAVEMAPGDASMLSVPDYFPAQFTVQARQAAEEALPPQF